MNAAVRPASGALATVLGALRDVKRNGNQGYLALCPVHQADKPRGTRPSLLVSEGDKGVMAYCYAGCTFADIVAATGLPREAWFYDSRESGGATPAVHPRAYRMDAAPPAPAEKKAPRRAPTDADLVAAYDYTTADGALLYQNVRYVVDGAKDFRQRRPDAAGGWIASLGREDEGGAPRVLYRLPDVVDAAAEGRRLYLVEGEKDVETLCAAGLTATTSGSATTWRAGFAAALRGADVVILPDHDAPGEQYAQRALADCLAAGVTARVVHLPGLGTGEDVTDWLTRHGHTAGELEATCRVVPVVPERRSLRDLLADREVMAPPVTVVPRLAWAARSTLLVAREKTGGKSTFVSYMAAAVSAGGAFLDERCAAGRVLIVGLEEHPGDPARRLEGFGADVDAVEIVSRLGGEPAGRLERLRQHITESEARLVVIDTFTAFARGMIDDFNSDAKTQPIVQGLTDLAHDTGVALLLVHHAAKHGGSRGSSAIAGAVDVVVEMEIPMKPAERGQPAEPVDPFQRELSPVGRVPGLRRFAIEFQEDGGRAGGPAYRLIGGPMTLTQRLLTYLRAHPGASLSQLRERVGGNARALDDCLKEQIASGRVRDDSLPNGYHSFSLTPYGERNR